MTNGKLHALLIGIKVDDLGCVYATRLCPSVICNETSSRLTL